MFLSAFNRRILMHKKVNWYIVMYLCFHCLVVLSVCVFSLFSSFLCFQHFENMLVCTFSFFGKPWANALNALTITHRMSLTEHIQQVHHARSQLHRHYSTYRSHLDALQPQDYQGYIRNLPRHAKIFAVIDTLVETKEIYELLQRYGSYPSDEDFVTKVDTLHEISKQRKQLYEQWERAAPVYEHELDGLQEHIRELSEIVSTSLYSYKKISTVYGMIRGHLDYLDAVCQRYNDHVFFSSLCTLASTAQQETYHALEAELSHLPEGVSSRVLKRCYVSQIKNMNS